MILASPSERSIHLQDRAAAAEAGGASGSSKAIMRLVMIFVTVQYRARVENFFKRRDIDAAAPVVSG